MSDQAPAHGGPDALGVPLHDFSTNANACGPCPVAFAALQQADRQHYPDPAYTRLRALLAGFHGVDVERIVIAASASEFIHRITAHAARSGLRRAVSPAHGYGDYARAAYAIAPAAAVTDGSAAALRALAPSWPLGVDGVALLGAWVRADAQAWLAQSLATLRQWKAAQLRLCADLGWAVLPGSLANFFTARPPVPDLAAALQALRAQGIKLRDCASFGLAGHVRLGVLAPAAQRALAAAWRQWAP